ncbi:polymeric immunoglobulin receptor-like [Megalops cyprinoides]|uniref:polymeric immunoglobulin receptor-like n=1 Tax=Megalops cyprinoides TaxID=118141 RepID=UPI0018643E9B|nr:polymeric immunoglobulin receptor-like [Megalops cyprinoides]
MAPLLFLLLFVTLLQGTRSTRTVKKQFVEIGGSVTIPCLYDQQYKDHVKYCCKGNYQDNCSVLVRTDSPQRAGYVSITDNPSQQLFTVTMRNLQKGDTATYWCGVETSKQKESDDCAPFALEVTGIQRMKTVSRLSVKRGGSVTIPCFYDQKYKDHVKYWCKGSMWSLCSIIVRSTDPQRAQVSITDDPAQQVFTVTLRNLEKWESGSYWCGVRVGWKAEDRANVHLNVNKGSVGLSVLNNTVVGEEGGSVSIQCLYSDSLRDSVKMWCRIWDRSSCLTAGGTGISQHASVLVSDDRRGVLTVTVRRLERKDTGWYWCTAGEEQFPVHITVTHRNATTLVYETAQDVYGSVILYMLLKSAVALVYITCTVIATLKIWTYCKQSRGGSPGNDGEGKRRRKKRTEECADTVTKMGARGESEAYL